MKPDERASGRDRGDVPGKPEAEALEPVAAAESGAPSAADRPLKPFFVLWAGQAISLIGSQSVQFALIWWLTKETGSAAVLAMATLVGLLPQVLLGPLTGALIDRWNRKRIMFVADATVAVASGVLAYLFWIGAARIEAVFALLLVRAVGGGFHAPAMLASTSLMVPHQHLARIQGLNQALQGALIIVAAPLGAALIALLSMPAIMLVDVASALPALIPLLFIRVPQPPREAVDPQQQGSRLLGEIAAGFRYIWARPGHLGIVLMASLINLFLVPAFSLLPLFVFESLNGTAAQLAWMSSAFGIGSLAGGIALGVWGGFQRRILTSLAGLVGLGVAVLMLGLTPASQVVLGIGAMFLVGVMIPLVNGPILAVLQATIAPEFQGRVFTLVGSLAAGAAPLGLLVAAPVAEVLGVRTWYFAGALTCSVMGLAAFMIPAIVNIEEPTSPTSVQADSPVQP